MHKKGKLAKLSEGGHLVGSMLPKDCGFYSEKVQISFWEPRPSGLPGKPHIHEKMDEIVIVLKGKFTVEMDGETVDIQEGEFIFKAAGTAGRAVGAENGTKVLIVKAPSVRDDVKIIE